MKCFVSFVKQEVKKIVNAAKDEINQKIDCLLQEIRSIRMYIGDSPYKEFKKIKNTKMLNSFVESMKVNEKKQSLVSCIFRLAIYKLLII